MGICSKYIFPKYLYKYRIWRNDQHKRLLTHNEIYFVAAKEFNDPFEATIPVRYDLLSKRQKLKIINKHIRREGSKLTKKEIRKRAEDVLAEGHYKDPKILEDMRQQRRSDFGLFSVSEIEDSILMWSHYSDSHKGFCVGFDVKELDKYFQRSPKHNLAIELRRIKYSKHYPILNPSKIYPEHTEESNIEPIVTKSSDWHYENEYRFIAFGDANVALQIDGGIIKKVILGCKMSEKDELEIKQVLKSRPTKVELLKAKLKESYFGLDFTKIDY